MLFLHTYLQGRMNLERGVIILLVLLCTAVSGCSTVHETVKETKRLYRDYVVPTPTVSLDTDDLDEEMLRLATLFKPVDQNITFLYRYVDGTDRLPDEDWFKRLFEDYPWISGVKLVDIAGVVRFRHPPESLKQHDLNPFMEYGEAWQDHRLRAFAVNTPLGPEVYLGNPFFQDSEWKGLVVVHFDPRKLISFCPEPQELILVSPGEVLWPGDYEQDAQALAQLPWDKILTGREFGSFDGGRGEYYWVARHLGEYHLIYAALAQPLPQPAE